MSRFAKIFCLVIVISLLVTLVSCGNEVSETIGEPKQTDAPQTDAPHIHSFVDDVIIKYLQGKNPNYSDFNTVA